MLHTDTVYHNRRHVAVNKDRPGVTAEKPNNKGKQTEFKNSYGFLPHEHDIVMKHIEKRKEERKLAAALMVLKIQSR